MAKRPKTPRRASRCSSGSPEDILRHLDVHGVVDKDAARSVSERRGNRTTKAGNRQAPEIDLHGMTSGKAAVAVRSAVERCRDNGIRVLLVIHGLGTHSDPASGAVLKRMVRGMLEGELHDRVRSWAPARPDEGGGGATRVFIR